MDIRIDIISKRIRYHNLTWKINIEEHSYVNDIALLRDSYDELKSNILYICKTSELRKIPASCIQINILCILDSPFPTEYWENESYNLIIIYDPVDINDLYEEASRVLQAQIKLENGYKILSDSLLSFKGLQHIVDTATDVFGNPILIYDVSFNLFTYSHSLVIDDQQDPLWRPVTEDSYNPYVLLKVKRDVQLGNVYLNDEPIYFKSNDFYKYPWMAIRIQENGKAIGHIGVLEYKVNFDEDTFELLKYFGKIISSEIQKNSYNQRLNKGSIYDSFITDLLNDKILNRNTLEEKAKAIDLVFKEDLYVFVVKLGPNTTGKKALSYINQVFAPLVIKSKPLIYNNDIVVLINREKNKFLTVSEYNELNKYALDNQIVVGVSRCFQEISAFKEHYDQANMAIELGLRLNKEKTIHLYEDYLIYYPMYIAEKQQDLNSFCSTSLNKLIEYDEKYQTDYTKSLYVYISKLGNIPESAKTLNIHRNSMDYRIKNIDKIMNTNIKDIDIFYSLYHSFKVLYFSKGPDFIKKYKTVNEE